MLERRKDIDILRGVCILYMIAGHIEISGLLIHYIHAFHMPVFFILSGYFYNSNEKLNALFLKRKLKQLILPYLIFALIGLFIATVFDSSNSCAQYLISIFVFNTSDGMPIVGAIWFLTAMFFAIIIYKLEGGVQSEVIRTVAIAVSVIFVFVLNNYCRLPLALDEAIIATGFMHFGFLFRKYVDCKLCIDSLSIKRILIFSALFCINALLIFISPYASMRSAYYGNYVSFVFNALYSSFVYYVLSKFCCILGNNNSIISKINNYIASVGRNSIAYLCFNQIIIFALYSISSINIRIVENIAVYIITLIIIYFGIIILKRANIYILLFGR